MRCSQCGGEFGVDGVGDRSVSISGSIYGDECTESWHFCTRCQVYTVKIYWDTFLGDDIISVRGPVDRTEGDEQVALIRQCPNPWLKTCHCAAHRTYFGDALD